jgi:shikimate 5-dehydrogenase
MVIISTMAMEVSIQAVSPEFGVHFSSVLASHAGGAASAAAAGAAAAGAAGVSVVEVCAYDPWNVGRLSTMASSTAPARATSPAHENFFEVMISLLSVEMEVRGV